MKIIYHSLAYITLIFLGILMCFYIGLRDVSIGSDTDNYIFAFESGNFISVSDPFYTLLNEILRNLNASHTVLFLFISIITLFSFIWYTTKYSYNPNLLIFVFLILIYPISANIMRQIFAISLFTYCVYAAGPLKLKRSVKFYIFTLLSLGTHFSQFIPALVYLLPIRKVLKAKHLIILWMLSILYLFFLESNAIFEIISVFGFVGSISPKLLNYIEMVSNLPNSDLSYTLILQNIILVALIYARKQSTDNLILLFILVFVQNLFYMIPVVQRYFYLFIFVALIEVDRGWFLSRRLSRTCLALICTIVSYYMYVVQGYGGVV